MTRLIRQKDWSKTPLGPREDWPMSLRTAVDMILVSPNGMIILWGPELVQIYNDASRAVIGEKHPDALGQPNRECWPEVWEFNQPIFEKVLNGEVLHFAEQHLVLERNGVSEETWFDLTFSPLVSAEREHSGILASVVERTDRIVAERALRSSERRLATAIEASAGGVFEHHIPVGDELHVSPRWCEILGLRELPVQPADFEAWLAERIHPQDRRLRRETLDAFLKGETLRHEVEMRLRHADGSWVWVREFAHAVERDETGKVQHLSGMILDITKRKNAESRVQHLARHDPLTGLANRALFTERLTAATESADRSDNRVGLILIDLDRFKSVNDTLGHLTGDAVLECVAARLRHAIRLGDTAARIGGDEFAVVLPEAGTQEALHDLTQRICDAVVKPVQVSDKTIEVTASLGVAAYPDDGTDTTRLMQHADLALYKAKASGRHHVAFFHASLAEEAAHRARIEVELRRAIARDELVLHFQPQIELDTGRVRSVEALVRWRRGDRRLILPGEFIGIAEASGVIRSLGAWVLARACGQQAEWQAAGHNITMAVNVSPAEASTEDFTQTLDRTLGRTDVDGSALELEITEGLLIDPEKPPVRTFLQACQERNIGLAIDDFGTGYSSLGYLVRLPITKIKIDRSFVAKIGEPDNDALVEAIVNLGHRLGRRVVAEGVERPHQLAFLREVGCDDVQGNLLAAPLEPRDLEPLLRRGSTR